MIRGVNLMPAHRVAAYKRSVRGRRWSVGVVSYAALLVAGWLVLHFASGGAHRVVASQLKETQIKIDDTQAAITRLQPRVDEALASLAAGESIGDQPNWAVLLKLTANLLGEDAVLTRCRLEPIKNDGRIAHTYVLHLSGLARKHQTVSDYVLALESLELFNTVKLVSTRREPWGASTAVAYQVSCEIGAATHE